MQMTLFGPDEELTDLLAVGSRVLIVYCSGSITTKRVVRVDESHHGYVWAWCELRRAPRCFRVDRMLCVIRPESRKLAVAELRRVLGNPGIPQGTGRARLRG